jgi:hypothetical protein
MTYRRVPWVAFATVAVVWTVQGCSRAEPEKSSDSVLDYSQPVYTVDHAIVCPMETLIESYLDAPPES